MRRASVNAALGQVVTLCARRPWAVLLIALMLGAASLLVAHAHLGVSTDTGKLFSANLPWKRNSAVLARAFPQNEDTLVAVIDAQIPEEAEATAAALAAALARDKAHFSEVQRPDALPYFEKNAFLFLDVPTLETLLDRTEDAQPFLGQLVADPSLRGLFGALSLVAKGVAQGAANITPMLPALRGFEANLAAAAAGRPQPLSWENLLAGPLAARAGQFHFVIAKPYLNYSALQPGAAASQVIRQVAASLEFVRSGAARVRLTGSVALDDEEFATVAQGAVQGLIGSTVLVTLWLFLAVRSWRLIVPILLTLLLGLSLTTGFATIAVGTLNLISVAFAILFVGIAVDFAIQFSVRLRAARLHYPGIDRALCETGRRVGVQIMVAAAATATGFLAFTPTAFVGVAQLGLIAGFGMVAAFVCTLTVLPALLAVFHPVPEHDEIGFAWAQPLDPIIVRLHRPLLALFGVLALLGLALLPELRFDGDPLHTKNPNTEAMETLQDLINDPITNPYTAEMLEPSLAVAEARAAQLERLHLVHDVLSLASFVPDDQAAKLPLIADASSLLLPTLESPATAPPLTVAALRSATGKLAATLAPLVPKLPSDNPLVAISGDLSRLQTQSDAALLAANSDAIRFLPMQLDRLRLALGAGPVTIADIPGYLKRQWLLPDGRARLEVIPQPGLGGSQGLRKFVNRVAAVAPEVAGSAVTIVRSADTIINAFRTAAISALLAIAVILLVALRRVRDAALVLAPLLMSALLTVIAAVLLPLPLNFANIIALPLLLGVGVSFNIYFVMNWRLGAQRPLGSATTRAVLFSALTTGTAFGSLALSAHRGTASMGELLLLSLGCTVLSTMVFVPALLAAMPSPVARPADAGAAGQPAPPQSVVTR